MITPILQFGTSRFLQAHADLFVSEAMARGEALGPITVVQTTGSSERSGRLVALADPAGFKVHIRGKQDGAVIDRMVRVDSIKRALSALLQWDEVSRVFSDEVQVVICNTADAGYDVSRESVDFPVSVPVSFPGKLTRLLYARFQRSGEGLTVLPAELIARNGDQLKAIVIKLARDWRLGDMFLDWIETFIDFSITFLDRIV
jgi:tagaturonate reductase